MLRTASRVLLAAAVTTAVLTGCGDDRGSSENLAGPDATGNAAGSPSEAPLTEAEAEAIAKASLLVAADLPGYESSPAEEAEEDEALEKELETCVGVSSPDYLADESSPELSKGEPPTAVSVSSEVQVVKTAAEGRADLQAFVSDKALTCFQQFFDKALQDEVGGQASLGLAKAQVTRRDVTKPAGAQEAFGLRMATTLTLGAESFPITVDVSGALVGRAELTVVAFAFGDAVLPSSEQDRLLGVVAERAVKAQA